MRVLMFQPQFAALVANGAKSQTIRSVLKRPIKIGEELSLRSWSGKPYRSRQIVLCEVICRATTTLTIDLDGVTWAGPILMPIDKLAAADGFTSFVAMQEWFLKTHGLPFHGVLIQW